MAGRIAHHPEKDNLEEHLIDRGRPIPEAGFPS
jgi:hypothetical protein